MDNLSYLSCNYNNLVFTLNFQINIDFNFKNLDVIIIINFIDNLYIGTLINKEI